MTDRFDEYRVVRRERSSFDTVGTSGTGSEDRRDESEAAEKTRERREDVRDSAQYQPLSKDSRRSVARSEASVGRSYRYGDGWHGGHTEWDHKIDQGPQDHDGRADTRTGFNPKDADKPKKYERLIPWQEDRWDHERRDRKSDNTRWVSMFCSKLDMTPYQTDRCGAAMEDLDMSHMAHYNVETVVLSIISLVANEDDRWIRDEDGFRTIMTDVGASLKDVRKCRQLIRRKSEVL